MNEDKEAKAEEMDFTGIDLESPDETEEKQEELKEETEDEEEAEEKSDDSADEEVSDKKPEKQEEEKLKEPTLEDIKKKLDEEAEKRAVIEKQLEENKVMQDNSVAIGQLDNELASIDMEAQKLLILRQQAEQALESKAITIAEYAKAEQAILAKAFHLKQKQDQVIAQKSQIPAPQDFIRKQQVVAENDKFYTEFEKNIEDEIVKKHVKKLKKEHYDPYAVELSKATDWQSNVDWIKELVTEAEARGFQKAQEKFQEKQAKGKTQVTKNNAQGNNQKVIVNTSTLKNLKKGDVDKALTFY